VGIALAIAIVRWFLAAFLSLIISSVALSLTYLLIVVLVVEASTEGKSALPPDAPVGLGGRIVTVELLAVMPIVAAAGLFGGFLVVLQRLLAGGRATAPECRIAVLLGASIATVLLVGHAAVFGGSSLAGPGANHRRWENGAFPRYDVVLVTEGDVAALTALLKDKPLGDFTDPADARTWDIAIGVDVAGRAARLVAPTHDLESLASAVDDLNPGAAARSEDALRLAVEEALHRPGWRPGTRRALAIVSTRFPDLTKNAVRNQWQRTVSSVRRMHAELFVIGASDGPGSDNWRRWVGVAGAAHILDLDDLGSERIAFDRLRQAVLHAPNPTIQALAFSYRPHLYLDRLERFRPLDVDVFFSTLENDKPMVAVCERRRFAKDRCRGIAHAYALTPSVAKRNDIYLDIPGELRLGADAIYEDDFALGLGRQAIYYNAIISGNRLHLDYWWFFRFNASPVGADLQCRGGLSFSERSCFDHEGDWEGMTVTFRRVKGEGWRARSVRYAGHNWPGYRYPWPLLDRAKAVDQSTHPRVYVALGSHASYPFPCSRSGDLVQKDYLRAVLRRAPMNLIRLFDACEQLRPKGKPRSDSDLPDGRHNGAFPWTLNSDVICAHFACVLPIPMHWKRSGESMPALWNAFGGRWGRAECASIAHLCVAADGPLSPWYQRRFRKPGGGVLGSPSQLLAGAPVVVEPG
jgi:hypothetical protein